MREENYFEKKLQVNKETLAMAESQLDHLDIQISNLQLRFDHDLKVYNDQIIHMQNIVKTMKENIPLLEKKIEDGYTSIDMKTGKAYKSFKKRHIGQLQEKMDWALDNQKLLQEKWEKKQSLKGKKREKLKPEDLEIVETEEIRESLQGKDEIKEVHEMKLEQLQKKADHYQKELEALKEVKLVKTVPIVETVKEVETIAEILEEDPPEPDPKLDEVVEKLIEAIEPTPEPVGVPIPDPSKQLCPECKKLFTKGGAFASHYKSHFPNGNGKE